MIIKKISQFKTGQKIIFVPKHSDLKKGDYVKLEKIIDDKLKEENSQI